MLLPPEDYGKPPFGRLHRLQRNHQMVRDALSRGYAAEIIDRVPVFARSYFHDVQHSALELMNRHDLVVVVRSAKLPSLDAGFTTLASNVAVLSTLVPPANQNEVRHDDYETFLARPCVVVGAERYSIEEFLFSILYTSGVHALPEKERLRALYAGFAEAYPTAAMQLLTDIGKCLVDAIDFLHEGNVDDQHTWNYNLRAVRHGPLITDENGKLITGPDGQLRGEFRNCGRCDGGLQMAMGADDLNGLAITADIRLRYSNSAKVAFLLAYGHRSEPGSRVNIYQQGSKIFVDVGPARDGRLMFDASAMAGARSEIRLEIFPSCEVSLFLGGHKKQHLKLLHRFRPVDGKITLGCDLDGRQSGAFTISYLFVDAINSTNR